ncbi:preprotein translocase subunit SecE [Candidatus Uhrbacteria bacterium]|nr:preprotein translocase subunit SecE [Candidatus Uhrbacteria bacterium]MBD3284050.1 preprotein translocase subunit SecE [Candidatus Uhrbacteria bacterium]
MPNPITSVTSYVRTSLAELKKVTWPTRETTFRYSLLVIVVSILVAGFFASLDWGFSRAVTYAITEVKGTDSAATIPAPDVVPDLVPTDTDVTTDLPDESGGFTINGEDVDGSAVEIEPSLTEGDEGSFDLPPIQ